MTTYSLTEWQRSEPLVVGGDLRRVLEHEFAATVSAAPADLVLVQPGGVVGSIRVGHNVVTVRPKVAIDRVLFMVAYANDPYGWRDDWASVGRTDTLT